MKEIITIHEPYLGQFTNCYVIRTDTHNIYIDAALKSQQDKLLPYLEEKKEHVLLLTHGHWDHIGASALMKQYGAPIYAHKADIPWLTDFDLHWQIGFGQFKDADDFPVPPERYDTFWSEIGEPVSVDHFVQEGDVLTFGEVSLRVVELSGHSAGSVGYYDADLDVLFTGDALMHTGFFGGLAQYCDYDMYCSSMQKLVELKPGTVYTAHTEPYLNSSAVKAAEEAVAFAEKICADVEEYLKLYGDHIRIGEAAKFVCEKEGKKWGCGACVCVLNHLARLKDPNVEKQVDFKRYLCNL